MSGTALGTSGVTVTGAPADQTYVALTLDPILAVANLNNVFSSNATSYGMSLSPAGIATAEIDGLGNLNLTPTGNEYGPVTITLTAGDANYGSSEVTFTVLVVPALMRVDAEHQQNRTSSTEDRGRTPFATCRTP